MDTPSYSHDHIRAILKRTRTIAMVGVSLNDVRPSYYVARYLKLKGFKVIPVNPRYAGTQAFGETVAASLDAIGRAHDPIDMVDIFRRAEDAGGVVDWEAAKRAEARGLTVIMNHCPKIEYQRLWGELRWGGFNTGVISSKLR